MINRCKELKLSNLIVFCEIFILFNYQKNQKERKEILYEETSIRNTKWKKKRNNNLMITKE